MSHRIRLKGSKKSNGIVGTKTRWPWAAKARAVMWKHQGQTAVGALRIVGEEFSFELKKSYTTLVGAHSHLHRFRRELRQVLQNPTHRDHAQVSQIANRLEIADMLLGNMSHEQPAA